MSTGEPVSSDFPGPIPRASLYRHAGILAPIAMTAVAAIGPASGMAAHRRSDSRKKVAAAGIIAMTAVGAVLAFVAGVPRGF